MKSIKLSTKTTVFVLTGVIATLCLPAYALTLPDFATLVERYGSSVVSVNTLTILDSGPRTVGESARNTQMPQTGEVAIGSGTGFIISHDGFIITSAHVVDTTDRIVVRTSDRREFSAQVVGIDTDTDVALLKVDANGLDTVRVGDSAELRVGDWVLAIGTPFGLDLSATVGIVSGLGRTIPTEMYVPFIQTDVAVNPGNSGGPLFNEQGEVIGVTSQILSPTGINSGVTFAIPINDAMRVANQLRMYGYATRGWLGIGVHPVNQAIANLLALDRPRGALVQFVVPGGPADQAGLQEGDLVTEFGGKPIDQAIDLLVLAAAAEINESVQLTILRNGVRQERTVRVGERGNPLALSMDH